MSKSLDLNRTVLLPIDMQRAFDGPAWPKRWNAAVDANGLALLQRWRETGRPIVHVRHDSVELGSSLAPGTDGNRFRPGFEPANGEQLVTKSVNSAKWDCRAIPTIATAATSRRRSTG